MNKLFRSWYFRGFEDHILSAIPVGAKVWNFSKNEVETRDKNPGVWDSTKQLWVGIPEWPVCDTIPYWKDWATSSRYTDLCLRCSKDTVFIDIDIDNAAPHAEALVSEIDSIIRSLLPIAPCRSRPGVYRKGYFYRISNPLEKKERVMFGQIISNGSRSFQAVEFLGKGQQ